MNLARLAVWFGENVPGSSRSLTTSMIVGGRSNLTYEVRDEMGERWVLRRPPSRGLVGSAHDVIREFRILSALQEREVPIPQVLGACEDDSVIGAPFYVMRFVEGLVLRTTTDAQRLLPDARRSASANAVRALAAIHAIDFEAVGLGGLSKRSGYLERQLRTWHRQWTQLHVSDGVLVEEVLRLLRNRIPKQTTTTLVHGDFRIDNLVLGEDGDVRAVLDWELSTLGDPLADLGLLLVYWIGPGDHLQPLPSPPTAAPDFLTKDEILSLYAEITGRSVSEISTYVAFSYWKLAVVLEGVTARMRQGAYGQLDFEDFTEVAEQLLIASSILLAD